MNWQEVIEHPSLRDLPFKIELNEYGAIVMLPTTVNRSIYQGRINSILGNLRPDGKAVVELAVWMPKGTKAVNVAWLSAERLQLIKGRAEAQIAPEVCVEVLSTSNTVPEITAKRRLYFGQDAQEVWVCDEYGKMSFYNAQGKLKHSLLFPDFPTHIVI